jgi:hypothetical protein
MASDYPFGTINLSLHSTLWKKNKEKGSVHSLYYDYIAKKKQGKKTEIIRSHYNIAEFCILTRIVFFCIFIKFFTCNTILFSTCSL